MLILLFLCISSVLSRPSSWEINMNRSTISGALYGDMILTPRQIQRYENSGDAIRNTYRKESSVNRWRDNIVPFVIGSQYSQKQRQLLRQSFRGLEAVTCFRFVERTNQEDYLYIVPLDGCYSYVGKVGGRQTLSLAFDCLADYIIWHEIMHALGFEHEHQRPDRDQWIRVEYSNVQPGQMGNFEKVRPDEVDYPDRYDYKSIMHYDGFAFGKLKAGVRLATMIPLKSGVVLNDNLELSPSDILKLNRLGSCDKKQQNRGNTEVSACRDKLKGCANLADQGLCSHPMFTEKMAVECAKTCRKCNQVKAIEPNDCEDHPSVNCDSLMAQCGQKTYDTLMTSLCPKTCGRCSDVRRRVCQDLDSQCSAMASNGFCTNAQFKDQHIRCAKTCSLC